MAANADFKYIYSSLDRQEMLYLYNMDIHEDNNLIGESEYKEISDKLKNHLFQYFYDTDQKHLLNDNGKNWRHYKKTSFKMPRTTSNYPCSWYEERAH